MRLQKALQTKVEEANIVNIKIGIPKNGKGKRELTLVLAANGKVLKVKKGDKELEPCPPGEPDCPPNKPCWMIVGGQLVCYAPPCR